MHAKTGGDVVLKGLLLARQLVELVEQALRIHLGADSHDQWEDCGWKRLARHGKHGSQHFIDNADFEALDDRTRPLWSFLKDRGPDRLEVKGCIGPFCQTQVWQRAR